MDKMILFMLAVLPSVLISGCTQAGTQIWDGTKQIGNIIITSIPAQKQVIIQKIPYSRGTNPNEGDCNAIFIQNFPDIKSYACNVLSTDSNTFTFNCDCKYGTGFGY